MEQPFNLVSNTTLKKNVADYTLIVIGAFLQALSYSLFLPLSILEFTIVQTGSKQNRFWTSPTIARILKTTCEIAWMKSSTQKLHSCKPRTAKPACIVRLRIFAENSVFTDFPYIHPQFHSGSG